MAGDRLTVAGLGEGLHRELHRATAHRPGNEAWISPARRQCGRALVRKVDLGRFREKLQGTVVLQDLHRGEGH
jgi:hypothetical protein